MYFSSTQIELSLDRLAELHPFFGTTFLALKELNLPIGDTMSIHLTSILETFLQKHYRPSPQYPDFYIPLKLHPQPKDGTQLSTPTLYTKVQ